MNKIFEAYQTISQHNGRAWVTIATIAAATGMRPAEMATEINHLMATDENFRAEPQPHRHRITADDKRYAVKIGGEERHMIGWS